MTHLVALSKQSKTKKSEEHRKLAITSHMSKVLYTTVLSKSSIILKPQISKIQFGLITRKGTIEAISTVLMILMTCVNRRKSLYLEFIDLTKVFHQVDHTKLLSILRDGGVEGKMLHLMSNINTEQTAVMRRDRLDRSVSIKCGVRQACFNAHFVQYIRRP